MPIENTSRPPRSTSGSAYAWSIQHAHVVRGFRHLPRASVPAGEIPI